MIRSDEFWMRRCLELAKQGAGYVSPNPMVGSVIVKNGKNVSEGFHANYGGHHAEINAINDAVKKKIDLSGATIYVNLEPCFHFGKTPPCVDTILTYGFSRIVVATKDPNPLVEGKSLKKLKQHGVLCTVGILKNEAEKLNEKFFKFIKSGIPLVAIKAAQTSDGFIAKEDGSSKWITNERSRKQVHQLRSEYDAIAVGANTVIYDDPELTVRNVKGRTPVRIVIDGQFRVPIERKAFNSNASTILYTTKLTTKEKQKKAVVLRKNNITVVEMKGHKNKLNVRSILRDMANRGISSVLVEGGQQLYAGFLNAGVVDRVYLFTAGIKFGTGIKTFENISRSYTLKTSIVKKYGTDVLEESHVKYK